MDEREQQRKIRHRLAILRHAEKVTGDVSATWRYYGIPAEALQLSVQQAGAPRVAVVVLHVDGQDSQAHRSMFDRAGCCGVSLMCAAHSQAQHS